MPYKNSRSARLHRPAIGVLSFSSMTELIGIAAVAIVAWFAAGTIWNVRKGRTLMRWMQGGLPLLGERTTVRWLGSTAVEMVIRDGKAPFASVTLVIFLEPRDLPWMWALGRSRGRMLVRAAACLLAYECAPPSRPLD